MHSVIPKDLSFEYATVINQLKALTDQYNLLITNQGTTESSEEKKSPM
ncbi:hypothetical protein [Chryseobacterium sp. JAH]|nr:hypothetical protein [Chryseobacterium sp. JAH]